MSKLPKKGAPFVRYVNVYMNGEDGKLKFGTGLHASRARALRAGSNGRIATLKLTTVVEVV